jgi:WD40 repeat protein
MVDFAQVRRLQAHEGPVARVEWSRDGHHLASTSSDGKIRIWSLAQNRDVSFAFYAEAPARLSHVAVSPDGKWVAAGANDGTIRIWDSGSTELLRKAGPDNASTVESLAWNRTGAVAACHANGTITIISSDPAREVQRLENVTCETRIVFADGDKFIAMAQRGAKQIALVPVPGSQSADVVTIDGLGAAPFGLTWDEPRGRLFASCDDGNPRSVNVATRTVQSMTPIGPPDHGSAGSLSVSPEGKWLATTGDDRYVRIYDVPANAGAEMLPMEEDEPNAVGFNADGSKLAASGIKNRLYVWNRGPRGSDRVAVVDAGLARPLVAGVGENAQPVGWMSWVSNDTVAVATGASTIRVIVLDAGRWAQRIAAIAPRKLQP